MKMHVGGYLKIARDAHHLAIVRKTKKVIKTDNVGAPTLSRFCKGLFFKTGLL